MEIVQGDIVLCEFFFSDLNRLKQRPVLVFKDNLPFNDFIGIPISSKIEKLKDDEFIIQNNNFKKGHIPKTSKLMIRKPFAISKNVISKKYGSLNDKSFSDIQKSFCLYFSCTSL
jgi:mRNA interferase MazF